MLSINQILMFMKQIFFLCLCSLVLFACQSEPKTVQGRVVDATMNTVMLSYDNDTVFFSTMDCDKTAVDGLLIDDLVEVVYSESENGNVAISMKTIEKGKYAIMGRWVEKIEGTDMVQGIEIMEDGKCQSINMATLIYETWSAKGDMITFTGKSIGSGGEFVFSEEYKIKTLTGEKLVLLQGGIELSYSRQM